LKGKGKLKAAQKSGGCKILRRKRSFVAQKGEKKEGSRTERGMKNTRRKGKRVALDYLFSRALA